MIVSRAAPKVSERHLRVAHEETLRLRLIARDERALVELIDYATPWLLGIAEGIVRDSADAEEVVMETFRQVWDKGTTLEETGFGLMPWMLRVTRNRAIDHIRSRRRRDAASARLAEDGEQVAAVAATEPDEAGQPGWHVHGAVHQALGELPSDQQTAVRLAYFHGLTHSEIAETLNIPIGTVKSRLRMAVDKLRVSLSSVRDWIL